MARDMAEDAVALYTRPDTGAKSCIACRREAGKRTYYANHEYRLAKDRTKYALRGKKETQDAS